MRKLSRKRRVSDTDIYLRDYRYPGWNDFARRALKLSPDAVPDISKVHDWSFAEAAR